MKIIKTHDDGWGCVPQLKEVALIIREMGNDKYEINNCVRSSTTEGIVENLTELMNNALDILNSIDTEVEYKTIPFEDFEDEED